METLGDRFPAFSGHKFLCKFCDFSTSKKSHYTDHLTTLKHQKRVLGDAQVTKTAVFRSHDIFICNSCNKTYKSRNGLWKHQKTCFINNNMNSINNINNTNTNSITDKDIIMMLVNQNNLLMETIKNGTHNTQQSNNINSLNKTFNLHFFLNETCKNAMNIGEFVSSIKPQLADLETTGKLGYVEGVSNIILNNLKSLKIHDRPIHCSDQKRETIYIKYNDEWTKEDDNKPILTKAIKVIANENIKNIIEWKNEHPDCTNINSKTNNLYLKIVSNSMSGSSIEETSKNINKIISNVAKQVIIDKHNK